MFDHLDDPDPPATAGWRPAVARRVRRRRRRRAALATGSLAVVAVLAASGVRAADQRLQPQQVEVAGLAAAPPAPGQPETFLLVGLDGARPAPGDPDASGPRTDTIVLARTDPAAGEVRLLVVPRDLWVPIAGTATEERVNAAWGSGGPSRLVETLSAQLGVEVDHYVEVDLGGAARIVDALGGLRLSVPHPVSAASTGLVLGAGCQVLDGEQVLALGRARRDVVVADPSAGSGGRPDRSGDLGRQERPAAVAVALVRAVGRVGPADLPRLLEVGLGEVWVDAGLERDDLLALGRRAAAATVVPIRLPVVDDEVGAAQVLRLGPGAEEVVVAFLDGGEPPAPESAGEPGEPPATPPTGDETGLAAC